MLSGNCFSSSAFIDVPEGTSLVLPTAVATDITVKREVLLSRSGREETPKGGRIYLPEKPNNSFFRRITGQKRRIFPKPATAAAASTKKKTKEHNGSAAAMATTDDKEESPQDVVAINKKEKDTKTRVRTSTTASSISVGTDSIVRIIKLESRLSCSRLKALTKKTAKEKAGPCL